MTEKLYYTDAYIREFEAMITNVRTDGGIFRIALDQSAFYPEGGGQGADHGTLTLQDGITLTVTDVQEEGETIWHTLAEAGTKENASDDLKGAMPKRFAAENLRGMKVKGRIDWERRFDHMQQHSGEHIVSGMICSAFSCNNVGFHMGEDVTEIDYDVPISFEQAKEIEAAANAYIRENHAFVQMWPSAEELETLQYRSKKELEGDVRITSFPGADMCACCGTHVSSSAQVGMVFFISARKFHEGTRLELLCGRRAMDCLTGNWRENKASAMLLSTSEDNTSAHVEKLIGENIKLKADLSAIQDKLIEKWAESMKGQENVLIIEDWIAPDMARKLADHLADSCRCMAAVFAASENGYTYSVIKRNEDISAFIKEMNAALNGRGGGRGGFAQGSVKADEKAVRSFFEKILRPPASLKD